jgi:predicted transcriptional regulator
MSSKRRKKLIGELVRSRKLVGEIYPVLKTKDGRILVGKHRAAVGWQKVATIDDQVQALAEKLGVSLKVAELLFVINSNIQRRPSKKETQSLLLELCEELEKCGYPTEKIGEHVTDLVPYDRNYVLSLLPDKFKQRQKAVSPGRPPKPFVFFKKTKKPGYEILPPIQVPSQVYQEFVALAKEANLDTEELVVQLIRDWVEQRKGLYGKEYPEKKLKAEDVSAAIKELWGNKPFTYEDINKQLLPVLGISYDELIDMLSELVDKNSLQYEERDGTYIFKLTMEVKAEAKPTEVKPTLPDEAVKYAHAAAVINKPFEEFKTWITGKFPSIDIDELLKAANAKVEGGVMKKV